MINAHTCQKDFKKTRLAVELEIERRSGKPSGLIKSKPKCPPEMLYLWDLYNQVLKGCEKIGFLELAAFNNVTKLDLSSSEIEILIEVDIRRRNHHD